MRQRHSYISHGSNVEHNALRSWHATMYKFVRSMVLCGMGMQQCAMHNATIQKTTFFELGVNIFSRLMYVHQCNIAFVLCMYKFVFNLFLSIIS